MCLGWMLVQSSGVVCLNFVERGFTAVARLLKPQLFESTTLSTVPLCGRTYMLKSDLTPIRWCARYCNHLSERLLLQGRPYCNCRC